GDRQVRLQAAHVPDVLLAVQRMDHGAGPEEQQGLEERVRVEVEDARAERAHPIARNIRPSCDTVEYASTRLMSFCTRPIVPAMSAVAAPITATIIRVSGAWLKSTALRPIMYTPAV